MPASARSMASTAMATDRLSDILDNVSQYGLEFGLVFLLVESVLAAGRPDLKPVERDTYKLWDFYPTTRRKSLRSAVDHRYW